MFFLSRMHLKNNLKSTLPVVFRVVEMFPSKSLDGSLRYVILHLFHEGNVHLCVDSRQMRATKQT